MRLREFLIGTALMFIALETAKATPPFVFMDEDPNAYGSEARNAAEASKSESFPVVPSPLISRDKVFAAAYYDALSILGTSNTCSDFFGGPAASVYVFNLLIGRVRKDYFSSSIGMRMSGATTNVVNDRTLREYRFFEKVSINVNGSFYRRKSSNSEPFVGPIGTFQPNTKEVRVLILLHELGHLMKGADGDWLLPDDGKDDELSKLNSQKIEDVCGDQIKVLGKAEAKTHQAPDSDANEKVVRAGTQP
jgi:hypothetical protein